MYTVDTSVWVNSSDTHEAGHEISRECLALLGQQGRHLVLPTLVLPEIAGAISRTRANATLGETFAAQVAALPNVALIPLDATLANQARILAAQHRLRGADAVYAVVALAAKTTLISLDNEHLTRLSGVVPVMTPAQLLAALRAESENR
ncbi:PIN domain-containing protein [Oscillochloris sp. ZM17-4]|uniref:type II toxin-antitoxin system VapC family toxin n=1 Tax=Oscillochloris sp. ZM17-4 TaxID=2866714 RepID=UPI001C72D2E9|nr:PIN domain-containing protein [Oscillochloris sp. ZM17-4]MBX0330038.1 PIN domain-containing protein [Oscillochloris sp. ZM17-4]